VCGWSRDKGVVMWSAQARRDRLVARHRLDRSARDVLEATRAVVAQHSSDPSTPYLSMWARVPGFVVGDLERALCEERSLWRLHAMRRTLFVVERAAAADFLAGATAPVAALERRRVEAWLAAELPEAQVKGWLAAREQEVLEALAGGVERTTGALSEALPALRLEVTVGSGQYTQRSPISSRLLFLMAMDGAVVRTSAQGSWRASQYRWASAASWFGGAGGRPGEGAAQAAVLGRYLETHGPATLVDLQWWSGWSGKKVKAALAALRAEAVALEGGGQGFVLAGDGAPEAARAPVAALLPGLDPAVMGWKERAWYLGEHGGALFDRNGNGGPTVWYDGRVVGGWAQRAGGEVVWRLLEDIGAAGEAAVAVEAEALTAWMGGAVVIPRFPSPLDKELGGR
jgi:hypothetical protein